MHDGVIARLRIACIAPASIQPEIDFPKRSVHTREISVDRQVVVGIQQHVLDHVSFGHQYAVRCPQYPAVAFANRRPDRSRRKVGCRIRIFERGFPGNDGFRLAEARFDVAQPGDLLFAGVRAPGHGPLVIPRGSSFPQACKCLPGGREQICSPLETHEGTRLFVEAVRTVECHTDRFSPMFESEIAPPAGFGHAEDRIALTGIRTRAVSAVQPTLHQLVLFAEIGIIGHEDKPALLIKPAVAGGTVGHTPADETRWPAAGFRIPDPWIHAPDVGMNGHRAPSLSVSK